jgi:hypothetical protein
VGGWGGGMGFGDLNGRPLLYCLVFFFSFVFCRMVGSCCLADLKSLNDV